MYGAPSLRQVVLSERKSTLILCFASSELATSGFSLNETMWATVMAVRCTVEQRTGVRRSEAGYEDTRFTNETCGAVRGCSWQRRLRWLCTFDVDQDDGKLRQRCKR